MGIAILSLSSVFTGALFSGIGLGATERKPAPRSAATAPRVQSRVTPLQWARNTVSGCSAAPHFAATAARVTPLRVVRMSEMGSAPECAGRMRISGRMADVCAELDRLAEKEAQFLSH
jgi:hypothetical protein